MIEEFIVEIIVIVVCLVIAIVGICWSKAGNKEREENMKNPDAYIAKTFKKDKKNRICIDASSTYKALDYTTDNDIAGIVIAEYKKYQWSDVISFDKKEIIEMHPLLGGKMEVILRCKEPNGKITTYCITSSSFSFSMDVNNMMIVWGKNKIINNKIRMFEETGDSSHLYDAQKDIGKPRKEKDASVVGRAIVGGAIAGGAGAVVGALSAVEQNNKNREYEKNNTNNR